MMYGKEKKLINNMNKPKYTFKTPNTVLFITGAALSGKSTVTTILASLIEGCGVQSMDIFRLISQEFENRKSMKERNPFVRFGSCDSYLFVGDGKYTPKNLIKGFNNYAKSISLILSIIFPGLETQGVRDLIIEGVQLTPKLIFPYLMGSNKLIILTADEKRFKYNLEKLYSNETELLERYSNEKLGLIQNEIIQQSKDLSKEKYLVVDNSGDYLKTVDKIIKYLIKSGIIEKKIPQFKLQKRIKIKTR